MADPEVDNFDGDPSVVPPRIASWAVGFHGSLSSKDREAVAGLSVRDIALGRRPIGSGSLAVLTNLPTVQGPRRVPSSELGNAHVGVNGSAVVDVAAPATPLFAGATATSDRRPIVNVLGVTTSTIRAEGESLEEYVARRLEDATFVFLPNRGRGYAVAKRIMDLVGAVLLLTVTLPIIVVLAVLIRLDSPGPALFRQTRVTRGGRTFRFYKFRTMYVDAKDRFPELYAYRYSDSEFDGAYYKLADDPRNTRVGRWLRRTTLDELPNLLNVVWGDLSLVGPRPELPELVEHYRPEELACFFTKAGLTGLAQVAGRSLLTVRERLTLDMRYVARQTLVLDIRILWRTVLVVVAGKGAF